MARAGASGSPCGGGTVSTIRSSSSGTPCPVLPETLRMSSTSQPMREAISSACFSGSAAGRSILLRTGMMVRSPSMAM